MAKIDFSQLPLLDLANHRVDLSAHFRERLLLIFLRHLAWLPCQKHLGEVRESQDEFDRRGVAVAVVSFAEPARLIRYRDQHRWPFPLFADPKRDAYRAFTLKRLSWLRVFSPATLRLYFKLMREGRTRANYGKEDIYQGGGDFLLDRAGNILFAHRGSDPADRPPVEKLLEVIDRHSAQKT